MKLSDIRIGVPMLRLETRIVHATPRKPTAFERVILGMTEQFGQNTSFSNIPIERLFIDVLCVSDPGPLVTPTLSELLALDVIRCAGNIDALDTLILRDIEITERGQRMIAEDMLPAKLMQNDELVYFDPIQQKILTESESKVYRPVKPKLSIDSSVFESVFPEDLIRRNVANSGYRWFSSASQIERVESLSVQILWKDTPCSVEVHSSNLKIASKNESLNEYLASIESDDSYTRFIAPIFDYHNQLVDGVPELDYDDVENKDADIRSISQTLDDWPNEACFVIPGLNYDTDAIPEQAPAHQAIVLYGDTHSAEKISIEWNSDRSGCKILINGPHPVPEAVRATDREILVARRINANYGNGPRNLVVACRIPDLMGEDRLIGAVTKLSDWVESLEDRSDQTVRILWQGESQYLTEYTHKLTDSKLSVDELVQDFFLTLSNVERINGNADRDAWLKGLWKILLGRIVGSEELDVSHVEQLLEALSAHGSYPIDMVSELLNSITEGIKKPQSVEELLKTTSALRMLDQDWSPTYPSRLFTRELTRSVIEKFPDFDSKLISVHNVLFNTLKALAQVNCGLSAIVSKEALDGLVSEDAYVSLIKSSEGSTLSEIAHDWASEMDSLMSVLDDTSILHGTQLLRIDSKIAEISKWTAKLIGTLDPRVRSVYVFDTSALIENPEIATEASHGELFVVSKRVIEELDDKKLDEALRPSVSEAVRNLRNLHKEYIHFCDGDMSLLPSDYRIKGDNLILSVAVRYREYKPVLITNDNNLSLKARAEGLDAMSADEFLKRPRRHQRSKENNRNQPQTQKNNKGKQRRKR